MAIRIIGNALRSCRYKLATEQAAHPGTFLELLWHRRFRTGFHRISKGQLVAGSPMTTTCSSLRVYPRLSTTGVGQIRAESACLLAHPMLCDHLGAARLSVSSEFAVHRNWRRISAVRAFSLYVPPSCSRDDRLPSGRLFDSLP